MPNYSNSRIYKVINNFDESVYIGGTCVELKAKMACFKTKIKYIIKSGKIPKKRLYKHMLLVGADNFSIEEILVVPCSSKDELNDIVLAFFKDLSKFAVSSTAPLLLVHEIRPRKIILPENRRGPYNKKNRRAPYQKKKRPPEGDRDKAEELVKS